MQGKIALFFGVSSRATLDKKCTVKTTTGFTYIFRCKQLLAAFKKINIQEPHLMTKEHLIESSDSSIRDNLVRFNRKKDIPSLLKCSKLL